MILGGHASIVQSQWLPPIDSGRIPTFIFKSKMAFLISQYHSSDSQFKAISIKKEKAIGIFNSPDLKIVVDRIQRILI